MLGPLDYVLMVLGFMLQAYVVVWALLHREFLRYFALNFYMVSMFLVSTGRQVVLHVYGYKSAEYLYTYYWGDSLLTVFLYFAILGLYEEVFREMRVSRYIRAASLLLLSLTALFSYLVVHQHADKLATRFVVGLSQNLYFVGVVLTYLLWVAVLKLRETRLRIIHLVLSLGIYFSASAATYALANLFSRQGFLKWIPLVGTWLPLSWAYTFTRVPEEARLATTRVAPTR